MKFNENNILWIADGAKIKKVRIKITDEQKHQQMMNDLIDLDHFIVSHRECASKESYTPVVDNPYIFLDGSWAQEFTLSTNTIGILTSYRNPLVHVSRFMSGKFNPNYSLLNLFSGIENGDNKRKQLDSLKIAKRIICKLQNSDLPIDVKKEIVKRMWPNFGYYVIDGLDCTQLKTIDSYSIKEICLLTERYKEDDIKIPKELKIAKKSLSVAKDNGKVYSLAIKAQKLLQKVK